MDNLNRKLIESEAYYSKVIHYIHANDVQHRLCSNIKSWPYSSYHSILGTNETWLMRDEVLDWFGGLDNFVRFYEQLIKPQGF